MSPRPAKASPVRKTTGSTQSARGEATSPSTDYGNVAFHADNGNLRMIGPGTCNCDSHPGYGVAAGSSPSLYGSTDSVTAYRCECDGNVWWWGHFGILPPWGGAGSHSGVMVGTSPSISATYSTAFQGTNGNLWTGAKPFGSNGAEPSSVP